MSFRGACDVIDHESILLQLSLSFRLHAASNSLWSVMLFIICVLSPIKLTIFDDRKAEVSISIWNIFLLGAPRAPKFLPFKTPYWSLSFIKSNLKEIVFFICFSPENVQQVNAAPAAVAPAEGSARASSIECVINDDYSVQCLRQDDDVYVPFNFIRRYFEVSSIKHCW